MSSSSLSSPTFPIHDFATWEPVLRLLRAANAESLAAPGGYVAGSVAQRGWTLPVRRLPAAGGAAGFAEMQAGMRAAQPVQDALAEAGIDRLLCVADMAPDGRTRLHLLDPGPAVEEGSGPYPGALVMVEGAVAEPWRRLPDSVPGAGPAPSVDLALLERTLRERLPGAVGATGAEIAAAEARLGVTLPDELKVLYGVTQARSAEQDDEELDDEELDDEELDDEDRDGVGHGEHESVSEVLGCELFSLDELYVADAPSRPCSWRFAATTAVVTTPDAAVQGLVGSPGWIAFGDSGYGDVLAIDLTPGPRGHVGQVIVLDHEQYIGAELVADSLTDILTQGFARSFRSRPWDRQPAVARVNVAALKSIRDAVDPALEVLEIGVWDDEPLSLAPLAALPRLRTLTASPDTLADPLETSRLTGLEFLELGARDWRLLLDAGAVPRTLSAAAIRAGDHHPLHIAALANELLALWDRPLITVTLLEGDLGPGEQETGR
ncbi:SMI1/KNR4 family protein [Streptomyces sp. A0592]|uniref:SMI1/KNR4 family protein n=1 Tax=Streptomyces sp. A0592 TaxID=2563099 RepID=UPI001F0D1507|nr:SMI1/KNR4 family protein [Streptomyces sp. A0592]